MDEIINSSRDSPLHFTWDWKSENAFEYTVLLAYIMSVKAKMHIYCINGALHRYNKLRTLI